MNNDTNDFQNDDQAIKDFGQTLRQLGPGDEFISANSHAVRNALALQRSKPQRFWQKKLAVPYPVAAAILLLITLQFAGHFTSGFLTKPPKPARQEPVIIARADLPEPEITQTCVYLAGTGFINRSTTLLPGE